MPLVLTIGSLLWFGVDALGILFATLPMFVFGTMGGVVGAWMMPRPQAPLINPDEIENIFG